MGLWKRPDSTTPPAFNDDTRAYLSIPARHDVWRRASADWVAGLMVRGIVDEEDAYEMMRGARL